MKSNKTQHVFPVDFWSRRQECNNANNTTNNSSSNNGSSIGADGGSVSANGVTLTIPAGALATQTAIAIEELTQDSAELPDGAASASSAFAVTPHGQTFEQAVTLVIPTTGRADAVLRLADANDTEWEVVNDVTFEDGKATVRTTTFSIYIAVNMCNDYCTTVTGLCGTMRGECEPRCNQVGIRVSTRARLGYKPTTRAPSGYQPDRLPTTP